MPSFTSKTFSSFYKNLLGIDQSGNTGVDTTARNVQDGAGNNSAISLSDDVLSVQPQTDDTTGTMLVKNQSGSNILAVDTTNSKVLAGAGQFAVNTQYAIFGVNYIDFSDLSIDTHYPIPFTGGGGSTTNDVDFGTGTDPDDTFTTANTDKQYASQIVPMMWRVPDNIRIDSVTSLEGADNSASTTTSCHLKSYTFASGATTCLTQGQLVANNSPVTNAGNEQAYLSTWSVSYPAIDANKVILAFFRTNSVIDYSLTVTVKYHLV
tara:strand:+ start:2034 stop:2828 length:795 start_codon:yes stop_codon:yes gene_type:complete